MPDCVALRHGAAVMTLEPLSCVYTPRGASSLPGYRGARAFETHPPDTPPPQTRPHQSA